MSGQKQKRPYKRKPILIADESTIPEPVLAGHDKAEQVGQVTSVEVIGQDDKGFAVTMSATPNRFGMSAMGAGEFTLVKDGKRLTHDEPSPVFVHSLQTSPRTEQGRETLDISVVYRVEAAIGRTSNAWGMVDPLELIRAVDRVLRG